jgi:energy-coupling factor transporter ATP-binding protein EcfA2
MIRAEGVRAGYISREPGPATSGPLRRAVLDGLGLEIRPGEAVALVGANGSGKTTLLNILAGLAEPWEGRVLFDGKDLATPEGRAAARAGIGVVFSNPEETLVAPTVEREIAFGLENRCWTEEAMRRRVVEVLERFSLAGLAACSPLALSGGERVRVALAAALAPRPSALLVDEALARLDARHRAAARELIGGARIRDRAAVLWVTQDLREAALADRVLYLRGGRIAGDIRGSELSRGRDLAAAMGLTAPSLLDLAAALRSAGLDPGPSLVPAEIAESVDRGGGA